MEKIDTIFKNATLLVVADAATKGSMGILALMIARFFGPQLYGQYATASAVCGIFLMITGIGGFEQEFTRRGSIDRGTLTKGLSLNLQLLLLTSFVATIALIIYLALSPYSIELVGITLLLWIALTINRFHLPFRHLGLILGQPGIVAIVQGIGLFFLLTVILSLLLNNASLKSVVIAQIGVAVGITVVWFYWMRSRKLTLMPSNFAEMKVFFKHSLPFAASNLLWVGYFNFDAFMLSYLRTEAEVGIYSAVYRIIAISYIIGYAVSNTFTPLLFKQFHASVDNSDGLGKVLLRIMAFLSIFMGAGLYFLAPWFVMSILGMEYAEGIVIMEILSFSVFFRLLNFGLSELLTTSGRQTLRIKLELSLLLVNIIFNAVLIPYYGGVGAAIATLGAEAILFFLVFFSCKKFSILN